MTYDIIIVINSSHRAQSVTTHSLFPPTFPWVIVVPYEQLDDYKQFGNHLVILPKGFPPYLSSQRQWVMDTYGKKYKYVWMMDDDLTYYYRTPEFKLKKCENHSDMQKMFDATLWHLQIVPLVGISNRFMNNVVKTEYKELDKVTKSYAINSEVFRELGIKLNPFEPFQAQDTHLSICVLNGGYKNRIIHSFAQQDVESHAPGGCSVYRTAETTKKVSEWMAANHPEVTVKAKQTKTKWGLKELKNGMNLRIDFNVAWKDAYKPKTRQAGGLNTLFKKKS